MPHTSDEDEDVDMSLSDRLARTEKRQVQAQEREAEAKEIDNSCPICLDQLEHEYANIDGCSHRFHGQCISNWATVQNTCPLCKNRFASIVTCLINAEVECVKTVKNKDQTEKSFRGDVARDYVAEGSAYARQMREEKRRARAEEEARKKLEAKKKAEEAKKKQEETKKKTERKSRKPPLSSSPALFYSSSSSTTTSSSLAPPLEPSLPSTTHTLPRPSARKTGNSAEREVKAPSTVKRRGKPSKRSMEPSEEEQERWAIAESLRMATAPCDVDVEEDESGNEGDDGEEDWEGSILRPKKQGRKAPPTPVRTVKARAPKTPAVREVIQPEEQGLKWIRSKITGKWIRARVSNITLSSSSSTSSSSSSTEISPSASLASKLEEEMKKIQATSEMDKQSAEAAEVEARMLSFQSRISEFKRNAVSSVRPKLTIDALRTDPRMLLAEETPIDHPKVQEERNVPSVDGNDKENHAPDSAESYVVIACHDSATSADSVLERQPGPQGSSIDTIREPSISSNASVQPSPDLPAPIQDSVPSLPRSSSLPISLSSSLPTALSRAATSNSLLLRSIAPSLSNQVPRKNKSSKVFASMITEPTKSEKPTLAMPLQAPKLRNAKKVLGDCTNLQQHDLSK